MISLLCGAEGRRERDEKRREERSGEEPDSPTRIPLNVVCDSSCHFDLLCQFGANAGEVRVYVRVSQQAPWPATGAEPCTGPRTHPSPALVQEVKKGQGWRGRRSRQVDVNAERHFD